MLIQTLLDRMAGRSNRKATPMYPDQFLQMTFVKSRIVTASDGTLYREETRVDELTGLKLTRRSQLPSKASTVPA